jgi:hypothetical protein
MPPHIYAAVLSEAFIIEAISLRDLATFVIASNKRDLVWISDFKGKQKQESLHRVEASVYKIPHKQVVGPWTFPSDAE